MKLKLMDPEQIFVDSTHAKACATSKKMRKQVAHEQALWYEQELKEEIQKDRTAHGKRPLKDNDKNDSLPPPTGGGGSLTEDTESQILEGAKIQKCSISNPERGWFHKGEHKHVFAYAVETAFDKHSWILGYTVHSGNEHDSRIFPLLYEKVKSLEPDMIIMDAGYKTPAIAHRLLEDEIKSLFSYNMTKEGFFKKYEYAYDEYYDCYICPVAPATFTSMHREQRACKTDSPPCLGRIYEERRYLLYDRKEKKVYQLPKETIERLFGKTKEQHGFRYTQYVGKAWREMKAGLTFAYTNLKKLARILQIRESKAKEFLDFFYVYFKINEKSPLLLYLFPLSCKMLPLKENL
ncbi:transposase [Blautia sp. HCN-20427]|uniref:transposase n=1 Tax=Blautia sp. HCN-20427 TaxID=3134659 RepID=UPI0030C5FDB9